MFFIIIIIISMNWGIGGSFLFDDVKNLEPGVINKIKYPHTNGA
jgi:uncharacterized membrane protein YuzA (DUF378 family)